MSSENIQPASPVALSGSIVGFRHMGQAVSFFVEDGRDVIQSHHVLGMFYELDELSIIEQYFPRGGSFLDVGTNVGNHTVFAGHFLFPSQIIAIEPNPAAYRILDINIRLNNFSRLVDTSLSRFGLSDSAGFAAAVTPAGNLGGFWLDACQTRGEIPLVRGDNVLLGRRIDFIKFDVEGMELRALAGLSEVIRVNRPGMFIEVDTSNNEASEQFLYRNGYAIRVRCKRYAVNENFLILPIERA